jgi:hypothetical protein
VSMLVVRLQEDLQPLMANLVVHALMQVHGVESVTDLSAISEATLRTIMREPVEQPKQRRKKAAA